MHLATLPNGIEEINEGIFNFCRHLEYIDIPQGVIKIGEYAFDACINLESVSIPKSVKEIYNSAFDTYDDRNLSKLTNVYYNGTDNEWEEIFIGSDNDALTNATRKTIYYITLIDDGHTSSVTYLPGEKIKVSDIEKKYMHKVKLYTDEAMTKEFDVTTAINKNLILYVYIDFNGTKTTVSGDGKTFTVKPINIEKGNTVVLALYDNGKFVDMQSAIFDGKDLAFTTEAAYTNAKVMVWNDLASLKPICGVETVK